MRFETRIRQDNPELEEAFRTHETISNARGFVEMFADALSEQSRKTFRLDRRAMGIIRSIVKRNSDLSARLYEENCQLRERLEYLEKES